MFGITNKTSILLAFDQRDVQNTNDISLIIEDFGLGVQRLEFTFEIEKLNYLSGLDFDINT